MQAATHHSRLSDRKYPHAGPHKKLHGHRSDAGGCYRSMPLPDKIGKMGGDQGKQPESLILPTSTGEVAEGVGFEPTVRFHAHTLSKRAP